MNPPPIPRSIWLGSLAALVTALMFGNLSRPGAADRCVRKDFKTELVGRACKQGGQAAAREAMKAFAKEKKIEKCRHCHATLGPDYDLEPTGLADFQKLGGK